MHQPETFQISSVVPETLNPIIVLTQDAKKGEPPVTGEVDTETELATSRMEHVPTDLEEARKLIEQKIDEFTSDPLPVGRCSEELYTRLITNNFIRPRFLDYDKTHGVLYIAAGMPSHAHDRMGNELALAIWIAVLHQTGIRLCFDGTADAKLYETRCKQPDGQLVGLDGRRHVVVEVSNTNETLDELKKELEDWTVLKNGADVAAGVMLYTKRHKRMKFLVCTRGKKGYEELDMDASTAQGARIPLTLPGLPDQNGQAQTVTVEIGHLLPLFINALSLDQEPQPNT